MSTSTALLRHGEKEDEAATATDTVAVTCVTVPASRGV